MHRLHASLGSALNDARFAVRSLVRSRGFTLTALLTLSVGIGASTAIFSVVDGVLLRPLPFAEPDRIVTLWQHDRGAGVERDDVSAGNFLEWRDRSRSFEALALIEPFSVDYTGPEGPVELETWRVTEGYFAILGTPAYLGRTFRPEDHEAGSVAPPLVLTYRAWSDRFGADTALVGRTIMIDEAPARVVGVMPPDFRYPAGNEVWVPIRLGEGARQARAANYFEAIARLRPGVTVERARAELETIAARLAEEHPETNAEVGVTVVPLSRVVLGPARPALLLLLAAVLFLLLIACVSVANLLLARATERRRELATRAAVGAARGRLLRQLSIENLLLAAGAGAAGVLLANAAVGSLKRLAPVGLPRIDVVSIDVRVLGFAVVVSAATALVVGLIPALRVARLDLRAHLGAGGRGATAGREQRRLREILVGTQLALALVLLTGAGLVARSFGRLLGEDLGYRADRVVTLTTQAWRYFPDTDERIAFVREAIERLESAPGVLDAGVTSSLPLADEIYAERATFTIEGRPAPPMGQEPSARAAVVTPGYFATLGIPLRRGRDFAPTDGADALPVAVVSEALARRHFADGPVVGERIALSFAGPPRSAEIVGVVGDVRQAGPESEPAPMVYVPHPQQPTGALGFVVRTDADPAAILPALKERLWALNPRLPLTETGTLEGLVDDSLRTRRFYLVLLASFAGAALLLATVGIYGLVSYASRRRAPEVGIRMAFGATAADIRRLFLSGAGRMILAGMAVGLATSLALARFLESLLYEVEPSDPLTLGTATAFLGGIALLASWLPARRAAAADPAGTLRAE